MLVLPVILLYHFFWHFSFTCHFFCHVSFGLSFFAMSIFACHFVVIFCHLSNIFLIFSILCRKLHQKITKNTKFPTNDKTWQTYGKFAGCKNGIFLEALSLFSVISVQFSQKCASISRIIRKYSRKMTKKCPKKTCNFAGCQNGIFSRQCHFSVISVQFAQTYAKHQKLFEKLRKNDKNDNTWRKNPLFCNLQNCHFFCLFLWGHVVEFLSFFCHFGAVFQKYWKLSNCLKNDRKMTKNIAMLREKCNFCNLQNCPFFGGHFLMQFLSEKIGKGQRFEKNAIFATCKNYKKYK